MVRAISIGRTISFCVLGPATEAMAHPLCVSGSAVVVGETCFGFSRDCEVFISFFSSFLPTPSSEQQKAKRAAMAGCTELGDSQCQGRMHTPVHPGHGPGFGPNFFHFAVVSTSGLGSIAEEGFGSIAEEK